MILKNFDSADQYIDLKTQKLTFDVKGNYIGWYKKIDNVLSAIFVQDDKLYFVWNNIKYTVNYDYVAKVSQPLSLNKKLFRLFHKDILLVDFIYEADEGLNLQSPFEYLDAEDFDWGIFLQNIINQKARRANFINFFIENTPPG